MLLKLYILADEYDNPQFRRDILHVFIKHTRAYRLCVKLNTISEA